MSQAGGQKDKATLIEMVKLAYSLSAKGKGRKRPMEEILNIIADKTSFFENVTKKTESTIPLINYI